jgi:hypothetical protein
MPRKGFFKLAGLDVKEVKLFEFIPLLKWLKDFDETTHNDIMLVIYPT